MSWTTSFVSRPHFVADLRSITQNSGRQIDWTIVTDAYRATAQTVTTSAEALATATSIAVVALPVALKAGQLLHFGSGEFAKLTAAAAAGATSITVEALPNTIESGDTAIVAGDGAKLIKAGTVMCELSTGLLVPRAIRPGSETATCLLGTNAVEGTRSDALTGYGCIVGGVIYENVLPESSGSPKVMNSTYKTELQAAGTGFAFEQYADNMS